MIRIQLTLGIFISLTRPNSFLIKFSRWFSLFHRYLLGQISINISWFLLVRRSPAEPGERITATRRLGLAHWPHRAEAEVSQGREVGDSTYPPEKARRPRRPGARVLRKGRSARVVTASLRVNGSSRGRPGRSVDRSSPAGSRAWPGTFHAER